MYIAYVVLTLIVGVFSPLASFLLSAGFILFSKKKSTFFLLVAIFWVGYIGSFYVPDFNHDMTRYIAFMDNITSNSLISFLKQMYSLNPLSVYGLTGQTWPGSAIILYLVSKYSDYRIISSVTLALVYFVRILPIKSFFYSSDSMNIARQIIWIVVSIIWVVPVFPLSGFRWYLAISILMLGVYFELKKGFKVKYLFFYLFAAIFHPGALIFVSLRIVTLLIAMKTKYRYIGWIMIGIMGFLIIHPSNLVTTLNNQFLSYTIRSVGVLQVISNILSAGLQVVMFYAVIKFKKSNIKKTSDLEALNFLAVLLLFNIVMIGFPIFDRLVQFTTPVGFIILGKLFINKKNWKYSDFIIPVYAFLLGLAILIVSSRASFSESLMDILLFQFHLFS